MGVESQDLFKQWKMMQDVDRVFAEVAEQAAASGLDLDTVREVLVSPHAPRTTAAGGFPPNVNSRAGRPTARLFYKIASFSNKISVMAWQIANQKGLEAGHNERRASQSSNLMKRLRFPASPLFCPRQ